MVNEIDNFASQFDNLQAFNNFDICGTNAMYYIYIFTLLFLNLKKKIKKYHFQLHFFQTAKMSLPTVTKASKRNLRKKLSQYAKSAKLTNLTIEKETEEIFYNPNKVS